MRPDWVDFGIHPPVTPLCRVSFHYLIKLKPITPNRASLILIQCETADNREGSVRNLLNRDCPFFQLFIQGWHHPQGTNRNPQRV